MTDEEHNKIMANIREWREREKERTELESLSKWQRRKRNRKRRKAEAKKLATVEQAAEADPWSSGNWISQDDK
jgi:hypothetical protein